MYSSVLKLRLECSSFLRDLYLYKICGFYVIRMEPIYSDSERTQDYLTLNSRLKHTPNNKQAYIPTVWSTQLQGFVE